MSHLRESNNFPTAPAALHSIQQMVEANLEQRLGIRRIDSSHTAHSLSDAAIDTWGLDRASRPVIIVYARQGEDSAVARGLFWLDWLMDHSADFDAAARRSLGPGIHRSPHAAPRLLCIGPDFSRYDIHVVSQMHRHVELHRYRRAVDDTLTTELVHTQTTAHGARLPLPHHQAVHQAAERPAGFVPEPPPNETYTISRKLTNAPKPLRALFEQAGAVIQSLGADMSLKELKYYHAYRRLQNIVCLDLYPAKEKMKLFVRLPPGSVALEPGFTRDVRRVTHVGTGDLEITLRNPADLHRATVFLRQAYRSSEPGLSAIQAA